MPPRHSRRIPPAPLPRPTILLALWWASLAVVVGLTLAPGMGPPPRFGLDKVAHFAAYAWLALLASLALADQRHRTARRWAWSGLLLVAVASEAGQAFIPGRQPLLGDMAANVGGLGCGIVLAHLFTRRRTGSGAPRGLRSR